MPLFGNVQHPPMAALVRAHAFHSPFVLKNRQKGNVLAYDWGCVNCLAKSFILTRRHVGKFDNKANQMHAPRSVPLSFAGAKSMVAKLK